MLVHLGGSLFLGRVFVLLAEGHDSVARLRASFLHVLYHMGLEGCDFRLCRAGEVLKDNRTLESYGIKGLEDVVLDVIVLPPDEDNGAVSLEMYRGTLQDSVLQALREEVRVFELRQHLLRALQIMFYLYGIVTVFMLGSVYWYVGLYTFVHCVYTIHQRPHFYWVNGAVSNMLPRERFFIIFNAVFFVLNLVVCLSLSGVLVVRVLDDCQSDSSITGPCTTREHETLVAFVAAAVLTLVMFIWCLRLNNNFRLEVGDLVERQYRRVYDTEQLLYVLANGTPQDKARGMHELSLAVSTSPQTVADVVVRRAGSIGSILNVALNAGPHTRQFAAEVLHELLKCDAIVPEFVRAEGLRCLLALLRSGDPHVVAEAIAALVNVCQFEDYRMRVLNERALEELAQLLQSPGQSTRIQAGILEALMLLSATPMVCSVMAASREFADSLSALLTDENDHVHWRAAHVLAALVHCNPNYVLANSNVLLGIVACCQKHVDQDLQTLMVDLLYKCTEITDLMGVLVSVDCLCTALTVLIDTCSPDLHSTIAAVCQALVDSRAYRKLLLARGLKEVLLRLKDVTVDSRAAEVTESCLSQLLTV
eukprot:m.155534 g.155534  ORF g.155534 m.155534 type:complete len:593 (-) comp20807_c15_seq3:28-1806(-)